MKIEISNRTRISKPHWMLVDDNAELLEVLAATLEMAGNVNISKFQSATEALSAFFVSPERFTFVITDFEMPEMNGFEFGRHILAVSPQTKMVLATGNAEITGAEARRQGFCGLLTKPFAPDTLCGLISEFTAATKEIFF